MIVYKNLLKANFTNDKGLSHDYLNLIKSKIPISFAKKQKFTWTRDYEDIQYSILLRKKTNNEIHRIVGELTIQALRASKHKHHHPSNSITTIKMLEKARWGKKRKIWRESQSQICHLEEETQRVKAPILDNKVPTNEFTKEGIE